METTGSVTLHACVLQVNCCELLVRDLDTDQEVLVHSPKARCFSAGDHVCITYDGIMTRSIPPQINADSICRLHRC